MSSLRALGPSVHHTVTLSQIVARPPTSIAEQEHWRSRRRGSVQLLEAKYAARDAIEAAGMKGIFVGTGMFLEWALTQLFDWDSGKVRRRLSPKPGAPPARLC